MVDNPDEIKATVFWNVWYFTSHDKFSENSAINCD